MNRSKTASYDLHLHTHWSVDALNPVSAYFEKARELKITCLAFTEHNNMDSLEEVLETAKSYPEIRVIPAAELSVKTSIGLVHLLCYRLPRRPTGKLAQLFAGYRRRYLEVGETFARAVREHGLDFSDERFIKLLSSYRSEKVVQRQGVTTVMQDFRRQAFIEEYKFVPDLEAYRKLMESVNQSVGNLEYPPVEEAVAAVKEAGGLIVIAHPVNYFLEADRRRMDALREECALDGIECSQHKIPVNFTPIYRAYCQEHNLFSTAGSDSHRPADLLPLDQQTPTARAARSFATHIGEDEWLNEFLSVADV